MSRPVRLPDGERMIAHRLSTEEVATRTAALIEMEPARQALEAAMDAAQAAAKAAKLAVTEQEQARRDLAGVVRSRQEYRTAAVRITVDLESGVLSEHRQDTGDLLSARPADQSERAQARQIAQGALDIDIIQPTYIRSAPAFPDDAEGADDHDEATA